MASHEGKFHADDSVIDESLAKRLALVAVLDGFLVADTGETDSLDDDSNSLVVEVGYDGYGREIWLAWDGLLAACGRS